MFNIKYAQEKYFWILKSIDGKVPLEFFDELSNGLATFLLAYKIIGKFRKMIKSAIQELMAFSGRTQYNADEMMKRLK